MNDLELISAFRSDLAEADDGETARARAAVMEAISTPQPVAPRARGRTARRRWWVVASAAAVVAAVLLVASASLTGGNDGTTPTALAAVLSRVADTAAHRPPPTLGPGQYLYTKSVGTEISDTYDVGVNHQQYFAVVLPIVRQIWVARDGSGRIVEWYGTPRFVTPHDRQVWIASGRPPLGGDQLSSTRLAAGSSLDLASLPTDPNKLRKLIEERHIEGGPPGNNETFTIIGDMLRETDAPPKLRAALFQVAAELPNVRLFGHTTWTPRRGIAIGYSSDGFRNELVFDPRTSALLGERNVSVKTGAVTSQVVYVASGVVGSIKAKDTTIP